MLFTLTIIPMYSEGRPYRRTLSTKRRMTLRWTRIWKDSEKFVREIRRSSVFRKRIWSVLEVIF